jgi:hypothetical protein
MTKIYHPVRFDIMLPIDLAQDIQDIEDETGLSRCEIFRRAIVLFKRSKETQMSGGNVILREKNGTLKEIVGF